MDNTISVICLAAGLSRRMGGDKLLLPFRGKPFLQHAVDLMVKLPVHERILVTTEARLESILLPPGIRALVNFEPEKGQSGSVRIGVESATGSWYLFITADMPLLSASDLASLLGAVTQGNGNCMNRIMYPVINGKPSAPSLFSASFRTELLAVTGDAGGRLVRDAHPDMCEWFTPECPGNFLDVDDVEDYEALVTI